MEAPGGKAVQEAPGGKAVQEDSLQIRRQLSRVHEAEAHQGGWMLHKKSVLPSGAMKTTRSRRWWLLLSARCHVRSASVATLVCSAAAHRFETHAIGQRGHRFAHEPRCASQRQHLRCELLA